MARIRTIKPKFFLNEILAELPALTRLFFIGLWTLADRDGRLEDRPKRIKAELFPYDNIDVDKELKRLHDSGFVIRYKVNANGLVQDISPRAANTELCLIQICNWHIHQKIDKANEVSSEYPPPGNIQESEVETNEKQEPTEKDENKTSSSLVLALGKEGKGKEGKGIEYVDPSFSKCFEEWISYKKSRKEAYKDESSLRKFYEKLKNLSGGDPMKAQAIIDESMAQNWAGIFELKTQSNATNRQNLQASNFAVNASPEKIPVRHEY